MLISWLYFNKNERKKINKVCKIKKIYLLLYIVEVYKSNVFHVMDNCFRANGIWHQQLAIIVDDVYKFNQSTIERSKWIFGSNGVIETTIKIGSHISTFYYFPTNKWCMFLRPILAGAVIEMRIESSWNIALD